MLRPTMIRWHRLFVGTLALSIAGCSALANFGEFTVVDGGGDVDAGPGPDVDAGPGSDGGEDAGCGAACLPSVDQLEAGESHFCALRGGEVWCWGVNDERQVSTSETVFFAEPQPVTLPRAATAIDVNINTSCAVLDDGRAFCWGQNRGQIPGAGGTVAVPTDVGLVDVASIAVGEEHGCAALTDETVRCWGDNDQGQLGQGNTDAQTGFVTVMLSPVAGVASGDDHTCARLTDGTVRCWGENIRRGAGNQMSQMDFLAPGPRIQADQGAGLVDMASVTHVACQGDGCCAATDAPAGRGVYCWGTNERGQNGLPPSFTSTDPDNRGDGVSVVQGLASGVDRDEAVCTAIADEVQCWGDTEHGQLGDGIRLFDEARVTPMAVEGLTGIGVQHVAMSRSVSCAATSSEVLCWGTVRGPPSVGAPFEEIQFYASPTAVPFPSD